MQETVTKLIALQKIDSRLLEIEEIKGDLPIIVEKTENLVNNLKDEVVNNVDAIKEPTVDGKSLKRKKSVWNIKTKPYRGSHFAVYPPELIEPCILAGSEKGDIVLDPFMGSGTTAAVAKSLGRDHRGCELHSDYGNLIEKRVREYHPVPDPEVNIETILGL